ncbi:MAG: hypothetical protein Hyperionvirus5_13 [Hyperionvirus sp.]|uniref:E3 ubiquitin-protein ligase LAP n=1 Tax=Hyperionvirus sp. TaxID=2487770 RepID=A0A3G5A7I8_9VIRU|nr:MAG: hypothetical protein Hyperionvirus5_13 [Hyperionvirus sp.]
MPHKRKINRVRKCCRVCYGENNRKGLIVPCNCKGTIKYIHRECLDLSRLVSPEANLKCSICKKTFILDYMTAFDQQRYRAILKNFLIKLVCDKRLFPLYLIILGGLSWKDPVIPVEYNRFARSCIWIMFKLFPLLGTYCLLILVSFLGDYQFRYALLIIFYVYFCVPMMGDRISGLGEKQNISFLFMFFHSLVILIEIWGGYIIYSIVRDDYYRSIWEVMGLKKFVRDLE